jgi:hypothetical protein
MSKSINYLAAGLAAILLASAPAVYAMSKASSAKLEAAQATKQARLQVLFQQGLTKLNAKNMKSPKSNSAS